MPDPKSGKAGTRVPPAAPLKALDADVADPGEVAKLRAAEQQSGTGKYGSTPIKPFSRTTVDVMDPDNVAAADAVDPEEKTGWLEVVLADEDGSAVSGERYQITLPDGSVAEGTLDDKGFVRVEGFVPGDCQVKFPELDASAWTKN